MQRYFVASDNWNQETNEITIKGDDIHHISRVMRNEIKDEIICIHPDQTIARCEIKEIERDFVLCSIITIEHNHYELPVHASLIQALPKGDKLELIIQKGTELGASSFYLYESERSIAKWNKQKAPKKMTRFNKIIKEAAEQSYREIVPMIKEPMNLNELIKATKDYSVKLVAYEEEAKSDKPAYSFSEEISKLKKDEKVAIFIGPEGGFTSHEIDVLKAADFLPVKLGNRILRTETASFYALSCLSYQFE